MKLVKVQRHWKLYTAGMTVALRFEHWHPGVYQIEQYLRNTYGQESYSYENSKQWKTHWSKVNSTGHRPFFIGLRNADIATLILLRFSN